MVGSPAASALPAVQLHAIVRIQMQYAQYMECSLKPLRFDLHVPKKKCTGRSHILYVKGTFMHEVAVVV
jgi:hypothetical protein